MHLTAYAAALDELEGAHRLIAEETDLQLDAKTRQAAMWLITGRCIGLAHAGTSRARRRRVLLPKQSLCCVRCTRLRDCSTSSRYDGEDDIVRRWLLGRNVPRGEIMAAIDRQEEAMRAEMIEQRIAPPTTTRAQMEAIYGRSSEVAHNRRGHMLAQVAMPTESWRPARTPTGGRAQRSSTSTAGSSSGSSRVAEAHSGASWACRGSATSSSQRAARSTS